MYGRLILASLLIAAASRPGAAETNAERLARQAGGIWDAAHQKDPGRTPTPERRELFRKIDALTKIKNFRPRPVAKALGLEGVRFEKTKENKYTIFYEARASSGAAIEGVDLRCGRPGSGGIRGFIVLDVSASLDVEPQDLDAFLGPSAGVSGPGVHAAPTDPYYYVYPKPGGTLKLGFRPGEKHVLVHVVWDAGKDD